jgi:hypothetical protein
MNNVWIDIIPLDYMTFNDITGKWLYFEDTQKLHALVEELNQLVESGAIPAVKKVDQQLKVERIDERPGSFAITDEIHRSIQKSDLIICDLTEERPNVYYEPGYARGLVCLQIFPYVFGIAVYFYPQVYSHLAGIVIYHRGNND